MRKIIIIVLIISIWSVQCTEENAPLEDQTNFISFNIDDLFKEENNLLQYEIAKKRFEDYVYKDKDGNYRTDLINGSQIYISEEIFEFLNEVLSLRKIVEEAKKILIIYLEVILSLIHMKTGWLENFKIFSIQ